MVLVIGHLGGGRGEWLLELFFLFFFYSDFRMVAMIPFLSGMIVFVVCRIVGWRLWNLITFRLLLLIALVPWWLSYKAGRESLSIDYLDPPPEVLLGPEMFSLLAPLPALVLLGIALWVAPRLPWLAALYPALLALIQWRVFFPLRGYWGDPGRFDGTGMPLVGDDAGFFLRELRYDTVLVTIFLLLYWLTHGRIRSDSASRPTLA